MTQTLAQPPNLDRIAEELARAPDFAAILEIVRKAARRLTAADGACFVLKDRAMCYYADEDAIGPLWKGKRFPLRACISGWVMENRQQVVIDDIYIDIRVPIDAYEPTFVRSLSAVPIGRTEPVGALTNYWAHRHRATVEEMAVLQALADLTAAAMARVGLPPEMAV